MRTTVHPTILASGKRRGIASNVILETARDTLDTGDPFAWAMEVLFASQVLRVAYDSPRIGGGIDPEIATGVPSLETAKWESDLLLTLTGTCVKCSTCGMEASAPLTLMPPDRVQDAIVHAEAVALRLIALCERTGRAY